jgi:hypothetical protein
MGRVPQVDPEQLAALRRLRAAFGPIEILEVIDHHDDEDQPATQSDVADQEAGEPPPSPGS